MAALGDVAVVVEERALVAAPPPRPELPSRALLPPEQLSALLVHYRRHGVAFDVAWALALELIVWPPSRRDASDWRTAISESREGWRASYCGWRPERREVAVRELARILSDELRAA
jgi:hypothetical protein